MRSAHSDLRWRMEKKRGQGRWGGKKGLVLALDQESAARVRALAVHPDLRGDHITLAFGVDEQSFSPDWIPAGYILGSKVPLRAVGMICTERVQLLVVSAAGSTVRPWDKGTLHITVSKEHHARSLESNELLRTQVPEAMDMDLMATVEWAE